MTFIVQVGCVRMGNMKGTFFSSPHLGNVVTLLAVSQFFRHICYFNED